MSDTQHFVLPEEGFHLSTFVAPDEGFKTNPFRHQYEEWKFSRELRDRAVLWEQGTGKSWLGIMTGAHLFRVGEIDTIIVVAPNGVHRNWITEEFPKHLPDDVAQQANLFCYHTEKASTKWHQAACKEAISFRGLSIVAMSFDATTTSPIMVRDKTTGSRRTLWRGGKKFLWDLLSKRRVLYIVDEGRRIKTPKAKRTKTVVGSGKYAEYRRLLNGTPVPNGPFDIYTQLKFLDEEFWAGYGFTTLAAFKSHFGVFKRGEIRAKPKFDSYGNLLQPGGEQQHFNQLVGYRNLDQLNRILDTVSTRVLKEDVLDLPPKVYTRRTFPLNDKQRAVYNQLREEFFAEVADGKFISAPLAITRMLRFQQIASGFSPTDDGEPATPLGKTNPRLELVLEICEDLPHKAILWTRFRRTLELLMEALGDKAVRYDGAVNEDARKRAIDTFGYGDAQFFVANQQSACEGLTLLGNQQEDSLACKTAIVVEQTFDLAVRQQLEDRNHRIGQKFSVEYIDMVGESTIDAHILKALRRKFDVSCRVTGDVLKTWLA